MIRKSTPSDLDQIFEVINDAASAYQGVIPADRWREPYMSMDELASEIRSGVEFSCFADGDAIVGVMGIQDKGDVNLIRHAYVRTSARRKGIGARLLAHFRASSDRPILVGTWRAAVWAVSFYEKHGFRRVPDAEAQQLLRKYWNVPPRQMETSVVLADERYYRSRPSIPAHA